MPPKDITQTGPVPLKGLTAADRQQWDSTYGEYYKSRGITDPNRLDRFYRNMRFEERFGSKPNFETLKNLSPEERDLYYNEHVYDALMPGREALVTYDEFFQPTNETLQASRQALNAQRAEAEAKIASMDINDNTPITTVAEAAAQRKRLEEEARSLFPYPENISETDVDPYIDKNTGKTYTYESAKAAGIDVGKLHRNPAWAEAQKNKSLGQRLEETLMLEAGDPAYKPTDYYTNSATRALYNASPNMGAIKNSADLARAEFVRDHIKIPQFQNIYSDINLGTFRDMMLDSRTTFSSAITSYLNTSWLPEHEINWEEIYNEVLPDLQAGRIPKAKHVFDQYIREIVGKNQPKGFVGDEVGKGKADIFVRQAAASAAETLINDATVLPSLAMGVYSIMQGENFWDGQSVIPGWAHDFSESLVGLTDNDEVFADSKLWGALAQSGYTVGAMVSDALFQFGTIKAGDALSRIGKTARTLEQQLARTEKFEKWIGAVNAVKFGYAEGVADAVGVREEILKDAEANKDVIKGDIENMIRNNPEQYANTLYNREDALKYLDEYKEFLYNKCKEELETKGYFIGPDGKRETFNTPQELKDYIDSPAISNYLLQGAINKAKADFVFAQHEAEYDANARHEANTAYGRNLIEETLIVSAGTIAGLGNLGRYMPKALLRPMESLYGVTDKIGNKALRFGAKVGVGTVRTGGGELLEEFGQGFSSEINKPRALYNIENYASSLYYGLGAEQVAAFHLGFGEGVFKFGKEAWYSMNPEELTMQVLASTLAFRGVHLPGSNNNAKSIAKIKADNKTALGKIFDYARKFSPVQTGIGDIIAGAKEDVYDRENATISGLEAFYNNPTNVDIMQHQAALANLNELMARAIDQKDIDTYQVLSNAYHAAQATFLAHAADNKLSQKIIEQAQAAANVKNASEEEQNAAIAAYEDQAQYASLKNMSREEKLDAIESYGNRVLDSVNKAKEIADRIHKDEKIPLEADIRPLIFSELLKDAMPETIAENFKDVQEAIKKTLETSFDVTSLNEEERAAYDKISREYFNEEDFGKRLANMANWGKDSKEMKLFQELVDKASLVDPDIVKYINSDIRLGNTQNELLKEWEKLYKRVRAGEGTLSRQEMKKFQESDQHFQKLGLAGMERQLAEDLDYVRNNVRGMVGVLKKHIKDFGDLQGLKKAVNKIDPNGVHENLAKAVSVLDTAEALKSAVDSLITPGSVAEKLASDLGSVIDIISSRVDSVDELLDLASYPTVLRDPFASALLAEAINQVKQGTNIQEITTEPLPHTEEELEEATSNDSIPEKSEGEKGTVPEGLGNVGKPQNEGEDEELLEKLKAKAAKDREYIENIYDTALVALQNPDVSIKDMLNILDWAISDLIRMLDEVSGDDLRDLCHEYLDILNDWKDQLEASLKVEEQNAALKREKTTEELIASLISGLSYNLERYKKALQARTKGINKRGVLSMMYKIYRQLKPYASQLTPEQQKVWDEYMTLRARRSKVNPKEAAERRLIAAINRDIKKWIANFGKNYGNSLFNIDELFVNQFWNSNYRHFEDLKNIFETKQNFEDYFILGANTTIRGDVKDIIEDILTATYSLEIPEPVVTLTEEEFFDMFNTENPIDDDNKASREAIAWELTALDYLEGLFSKGKRLAKSREFPDTAPRFLAKDDKGLKWDDIVQWAKDGYRDSSTTYLMAIRDALSKMSSYSSRLPIKTIVKAIKHELYLEHREEFDEAYKEAKNQWDRINPTQVEEEFEKLFLPDEYKEEGEEPVPAEDKLTEADLEALKDLFDSLAQPVVVQIALDAPTEPDGYRVYDYSTYDRTLSERDTVYVKGAKGRVVRGSVVGYGPRTYAGKLTSLEDSRVNGPKITQRKIQQQAAEAGQRGLKKGGPQNVITSAINERNITNNPMRQQITNTGGNYDQVVDVLQSTGAFEYVNKGRLHEGDEIGFVVTSWLSTEGPKPLIYIVTKKTFDGASNGNKSFQGHQVIGVLDTTNATVNATAGTLVNDIVFKRNEVYDEANPTKYDYIELDRPITVKKVFGTRVDVQRLNQGKVSASDVDTKNLNTLLDTNAQGNLFGYEYNGVFTPVVLVVNRKGQGIQFSDITHTTEDLFDPNKSEEQRQSMMVLENGTLPENTVFMVIPTSEGNNAQSIVYALDFKIEGYLDRIENSLKTGKVGEMVKQQFVDRLVDLWRSLRGQGNIKDARSFSLTKLFRTVDGQGVSISLRGNILTVSHGNQPLFSVAINLGDVNMASRSLETSEALIKGHTGYAIGNRTGLSIDDVFNTLVDVLCNRESPIIQAPNINMTTYQQSPEALQAQIADGLLYAPNAIPAANGKLSVTGGAFTATAEDAAKPAPNITSTPAPITSKPLGQAPMTEEIKDASESSDSVVGTEVPTDNIEIEGVSLRDVTRRRAGKRGKNSTGYSPYKPPEIYKGLNILSVRNRKCVILNDRDGKAFSNYYGKGKYPKEFTLSGGITLVKSNRRRNSRKYDVVDTNGEILYANYPVYTKEEYQDMKEKLANKLPKDIHTEKLPSAKHSYAFRLRLITPGKSAFITSAKSFMRAAVQAYYEKEGIAINMDFIDKFVEQFPEEFWKVVLTNTLQESRMMDPQMKGAIAITTTSSDVVNNNFIFYPDAISKRRLLTLIEQELNRSGQSIYGRTRFGVRIDENLPYNELVKNLREEYAWRYRTTEEESMQLYSDTTGIPLDEVKAMVQRFRAEESMGGSQAAYSITHFNKMNVLIDKYNREYAEGFTRYVEEKLGTKKYSELIRIVFDRDMEDSSLTDILTAILHEPWHALELYHDYDKHHQKVLNELDNFLNTAEGKRYFGEYFKLGVVGDLRSEFLADLFAYTMLPEDARVVINDSSRMGFMQKMVTNLNNSKDSIVKKFLDYIKSYVADTLRRLFKDIEKLYNFISDKGLLKETGIEDAPKALDRLMEAMDVMMRTTQAVTSRDPLKQVVYQGRKSVDVDNREYNYFTLWPDEAIRYGNYVREVTVDTIGFLKVMSPDGGINPVYQSLRDKFREKTGKLFDILDSSPEGLKTQSEFFDFLKRRGFKGLDYLAYTDTSNPEIDNPYLVTFTNDVIQDNEDDSPYLPYTPLNGYTPEMQQIKDQAIANGTFMKAPNGKPTKLTERQWLQVRTKAFKDWFGDWENDAANASKVVDENGEPLVVYHGTVDEEPLNTVDFSKSADKISFFGTSNRILAGQYAQEDKRNNVIDYNRELIDSRNIRIFELKQEIAKLKEQIRTGRVETLTMDYDLSPKQIESNKEYLRELEKELEELEQSEVRQEEVPPSNVYPMFFNLRNPFILDAKGSFWNNLKLNGKQATTRDVAKYAKEHGYDGVVVKDVYDNPSMDLLDLYTGFGDVYIITDSPNQAQSATDDVSTSEDSAIYDMLDSVEKLASGPYSGLPQSLKGKFNESEWNRLSPLEKTQEVTCHS